MGAPELAPHAAQERSPYPAERYVCSTTGPGHPVRRRSSTERIESLTTSVASALPLRWASRPGRAERLADRFRCKDVMPSGRLVVGPFRESGWEVVNVSDRWSSPGIAVRSPEHPFNRLLHHRRVQVPVPLPLLLGLVPDHFVDHPLVHALAGQG